MNGGSIVEDETQLFRSVIGGDESQWQALRVAGELTEIERGAEDSLYTMDELYVTVAVGSDTRRGWESRSPSIERDNARSPDGVWRKVAVPSAGCPHTRREARRAASRSSTWPSYSGPDWTPERRKRRRC